MARLFDELGQLDDEPITPGCVIDIPETLNHRITVFIHRWGYNTTAQQAMRPELDALIAFARQAHQEDE